MNKVQVAISTDFFDAFAAIPKAQQKKVQNFVAKFRNNPLASGINYEKINDAVNPDYRSVRIDQTWRGIILKPDKGDVYLLLWVDKHDVAYDWARRHRCRVNPETGSLQVYEARHEQGKADARKPAAAAGGAVEPALLPFRERELLRLGVPEENLQAVKALTSLAGLEAMQSQLPVEAFEALYFLADGMALDEVMAEYALVAAPRVDTDDVAAALDNPHSRRSFHVVADDVELQQMLEAPLEKWRVFLHPLQRKLVERHWNGPVRVLGGAGTGKTVVAMHRARWLVEHVLAPDEKLLFTTFTRNLAMDIEANLRTICTPEQMQQIEVSNIDAWVRRYLRREGEVGRIVYSGQDAYDKCWERAMGEAPSELDLPESFFDEEWQQVVLPQRVLSRRDYFKADRRGRGVPLARKQRAAIWPVFEEMRLQLHQQGLMASPDGVFAALDRLGDDDPTGYYRAVVVDEVQDMGREAMQLIRALAGEEKRDDLMLVGDGHQRIYGRKTSLKSCGIHIVGRGRKLRINYRTTEQIRRWAVAVLEDVDYDDLDGGTDEARGCRSLIEGQRPEIQGFDNAEAEADWVVEQIRRLTQQGFQSQDICVVARTKTRWQKTARKLDEQGLEPRRLQRDAADNGQLPGVRLANMHRVKGLEFKIVFLVGIQQGTVPLELALNATEDPVIKRNREDNERSLLHVAATRAIQVLYVSWYGQPSPFLVS